MHPGKGLAIFMAGGTLGLNCTKFGECCHQMDYAAASQACQKISRGPRLATRAKRIAKQLKNFKCWDLSPILF